MQTGFKRGGYFVEFGATDGVTLSNTWLLEMSFGWSGILADPRSCGTQTSETTERRRSTRIACGRRRAPRLNS
ncbi:hypothetical protein JANAI62_22160 [Jannaschia pagri]|uniref:Uncharacterized protein n=1 Tax=Jannaschia pagri TaxID=2829797 RepID=A0ABQ4NMF8_9RHOB|nr:hypothetical protein JANAI61_22170 [Jannaschia sp. AI_61]GIT95593.1 hypothetical protein JANAI62_22160 [Jannaschia sp. AI_62]